MFNTKDMLIYVHNEQVLVAQTARPITESVKDCCAHIVRCFFFVGGWGGRLGRGCIWLFFGWRPSYPKLPPIFPSYVREMGSSAPGRGKPIDTSALIKLTRVAF